MVRRGRWPVTALLLAVAFLAPLLLPLPVAAQRNAVAVDLELVLAVDVSLSVDAREAHLQRQGYVQAFRDPLVVEAIVDGILGRIAVAYFEWANAAHTQVIVDWVLIDSPASAARFADALSRRRPAPAHYTSISGAIDFGMLLFENNGYEGTRRVIDVSGDGPNNWGGLVDRARDRAVAEGVTINGLPILDVGSGSFSRYNIPDLDLYYRDCVIGGPAAFIVVAENFTAFASAIRRKLFLEIAGLSPPETPETASERAPPPGLLRQAQFGEPERPGPPCDIGERLLRSRQDGDF